MEPEQKGHRPEQPLEEILGSSHVAVSLRARAVLTPEDLLAGLNHHFQWSRAAGAGNGSPDRNGGQFISSEKTARGETFWVLTDTDKQSTVVLLPSEYYHDR